MKAILCTKYGSPEFLQQGEYEKPIAKANEVLVKVRASAVTQSDIYVRSMDMPSLFYKWAMRLVLGLKKPRNPILGIVFAGEIESVGSNITRFKKGECVYGMTGFKFGCYAEYLTIKEIDSLAGCISRMPENINFEEASAAVYGGLLALQYLEEGNVRQARKVMIYGASGTSGTIAIQIAKSFGANVTAVCREENFALVKSLGADECIDYTQTHSIEPNTKFDLVLDSVGERKTSALKVASKHALAKNGKYVSIDGKSMQMNSERLTRISKMIEEGVFKPILDRVYTMDQIVEAHRYVEKGHKKGGVAIKILNA